VPLRGRRAHCWVVTGAALVTLGLAGVARCAPAGPAGAGFPHRVFPTSRYVVDEILTRPFDPEVPFGCVGDRVWASSPQGWAFRDDVHWIDADRFNAFDLEIRDRHGLLAPAAAIYYPSHVHYQGTVRQEMTASASFTFAADRVGNPLTPPFSPEKRWTCWSSGQRRDWYEIDLGIPRQIAGFDVHFFDDAPTGACRPPRAFQVQFFDGRIGTWSRVEPSRVFPERPKPGENRVRFEPVRASRFRLVFEHAGDRFYTGLYGLVTIDGDPAASKPQPCSLEISADKFITASDILVSIVRVHNPTAQVQTIYVDPVVACDDALESWHVETRWAPPASQAATGLGHEPRSLSLRFRQDLKGLPVDSHFRYAVVDDPPIGLEVSGGGAATDMRAGIFARPRLNASNPDAYKAFGHPITPGGTKVFKAALELRAPGELTRIDSVVRPATDRKIAITPSDQDAHEPVATQVKDYQAWFDVNVPYFDCSDPWVRTMFYHRAYVLRKNTLDPHLGRMRWPTQSEGRWRSTWYPNVISYGAAHQVREARWLRDPKYWQGHVRTWVENEKEDGVYPSHVTTAGPAGGQYTDWISATAWDGHLVQPDRAFLGQVVEKLARNVRGWQKTCDPDGDGLLMVDSHWWTGMEYQPSFFYFSDYKVSKNFDQPAHPVNLERVDLTAYNFGNATAVGRIYRALGEQEKAKEFDALAAKVAAAVRAKMWNTEHRFFYSLRAQDDAVALVKEVIGVYPFYFGMVPWGQGYESAWSAIIDPAQFWSPWPVASVSRQCPAYSQANWPGDGRAAACMWNGPTWPHANSLVLTAMARTLRATREEHVVDSPLRPQHLWDLFSSFTRAQYRDHDIQHPWTGEFYNGDTGAWKTTERDYNHSTWLDVLIPELLGLVPREDDVLEVDPLVPEGALSYFVLDGQRYHGHDVTIVWDAPLPDSADRFGDGRKGLDLYVDGALVASAGRLSRLTVRMMR
jgi:hypothetical protein